MSALKILMLISKLLIRRRNFSTPYSSRHLALHIKVANATTNNKMFHPVSVPTIRHLQLAVRHVPSMALSHQCSIGPIQADRVVTIRLIMALGALAL